jgi:hypothetical protein
MVRISPQLNLLIEAAKRGDQDYVSTHIQEHIDHRDVDWVMGRGLNSYEKDVRGLAAMILAKSSVPLTLNDRNRLMFFMGDDSYCVVGYRLAIALHKRDDRSPQVLAKLDEAIKDVEHGELVRAYLKK